MTVSDRELRALSRSSSTAVVKVTNTTQLQLYSDDNITKSPRLNYRSNKSKLITDCEFAILLFICDMNCVISCSNSVLDLWYPKLLKKHPIQFYNSMLNKIKNNSNSYPLQGKILLDYDSIPILYLYTNICICIICTVILC
jgi:hypothetical protein